MLKGRKATCYKSVASELIEGGAIYEDKEVVVDGHLVMARQPSDLPSFMRKIIKLIKKQVK